MNALELPSLEVVTIAVRRDFECGEHLPVIFFKRKEANGKFEMEIERSKIKLRRIRSHKEFSSKKLFQTEAVLVKQSPGENYPSIHTTCP